MQKYTSANTSQNQIPALYKKALKNGMLQPLMRVYDYGCGKYLEQLQDFAIDNNFLIYGYDKYNQSVSHNLHVSLTRLPIANVITCCNVLNVLDNPALNEVLTELSMYAKDFKIPVIISTYEGNKSGTGKQSKKDCYQRNMRTKDYKQLLLQHFTHVEIKNGLIKCEVKY